MITLILGVFYHFCKSARSASRQRKNFMESLHSDGSATYLLTISVEKIIPLGKKSKQKPYPSIVFLSIYKVGRFHTLEQGFQLYVSVCLYNITIIYNYNYRLNPGVRHRH